MPAATFGWLGRYGWDPGPSEDTSTMPGDVSTTARRGLASFAGAATKITISNLSFRATDTPVITMVEPLGSDLATVNSGLQTTIGDGFFTFCRSSGSIANQSFHWRVLR
jgi:hypothetical protein